MIHVWQALVYMVDRETPLVMARNLDFHSVFVPLARNSSTHLCPAL